MNFVRKVFLRPKGDQIDPKSNISTNLKGYFGEIQGFVPKLALTNAMRAHSYDSHTHSIMHGRYFVIFYV